MNKGIYTYAVIERGSDLNGFVRKYPEMKFLNLGNLSLIYKEVDVDELEKVIHKSINNLKGISKILKEHEKVVEELTSTTVTIPFKFGTILKNINNAQDLLKEKEEIFQKLIKKFKDKEEWGVKLYKENGSLESYLFGQLKEESISSGADYLKAKMQQKSNEERTDLFLTKITNDFFDEMVKVSKEFSISDKLNLLKDEKKDFFLNTAFLVNANRRKEFKEIADELANKYQRMGIGLTVSGPWPPYSFLYE